MKTKLWLLAVMIPMLLTYFAEKSTQPSTQSFIKKSNNMDIQYAYTILYVEDVAKTIKFYQNTFGFQQKMLTPEKDYGELDTGTTTLAFANLELGKANFPEGFQATRPTTKPFGAELAFTTQAVDAVMEKAIENGASLLSKSILKPWGQKVGYLRDNNGFILEICTPMGGE